MRWTTGPEHHQPFGITHGGVYCVAVETAASVGAGYWYGERGQVVGVSNSTEFLRPVRDGELTATQKLKRSAMLDAFGELVESLYR